MRIVRHQKKRVETILEPPHLIEMQLNSYRWFLEEGLPEQFKTFSPIYDLTGQHFIEFVDFTLGEPKYSLEECREREMTFEAPLRVLVRYGAKEGEINETEIYLGDLPLMTDSGTFIINGRERVIVSQITRSPGVYFADDVDYTMQILVSSRIIPTEGPWMEIDSDQNWVIRAQIHQSKRVPITQMMKAFAAFGDERNGESPRAAVEMMLKDAIHWRLEEDLVDQETGEVVQAGTLITEELLNENPGLGNRKAMVNIPYATDKDGRPTLTNEVILMLFGRRETLQNPARDELIGKRPLSDIMDPSKPDKTMVKRLQRIEREVAKKIEALGMEQLEVLAVPKFVESTLDSDPTANSREAILDFYRRVRPGEPAVEENARNVFYSLLLDPRRYDLAKVGRHQLNRRLRIGLPIVHRRITVADLVRTVNYMIEMREESYGSDDIDHLANKRVRSIGELLQSHLRVGFLRTEKTARERMTTASDTDQVLPSVILSVKPISAAIRSFFATSRLSTFMDQTNPLAELANKRRLSALGPGGLTRQSAKLEVRDVHRSHYGRVCPIETPEGQNIGLINQLTLYGRVDEFGFIRTPYRIVKDGHVTDEIVHMSAAEDDDLYVAPADVPIDENGRIISDDVQVRHQGTYPTVKREDVRYMDVAPAQIFSVSTAMIPFVENDDANRALMGANMQRQAVPLLKPDAPLVHTGAERKAAYDAPSVVVAEADGVVSFISSNEIRVTREDEHIDTYSLTHMHQSNKGTTFTYLPCVRLGQRVRAGEPLADGASTENGELALGKNILVAFLPWGGYNYEDAILVSERLLHEETFNSIHLERYQAEATDTKLGPEEITSDLPGAGEDARRNLDENGIIRIGAEVAPDDILVGKIAPKGQTESSAEQRLIIAIFGKKAEEMRDVSLKLPHGERGYVIKVTQFARFKYQCANCQHIAFFSKLPENLDCAHCRGQLKQLPADELAAGTNHLARVLVATRRPLTEGDKMAGRHGNKGVISKILPMEDMPFLADGTPVDIVLNPLGVPSRMNIGQILELHLGLVAKKLGLRFQTPAFQGSTDEEIQEEIQILVDRLRRDALLKFAREEMELNIQVSYRANTEDALEAVMDAIKDASEEQKERVSLCTALPVNAPLEEIRKVIEERMAQRSGFDAKSGKAILRDGRTGDQFENHVAVGYVYMLKLEHLAEEKIHARSIGPYSLVTQQPLGGKAQFGGQRFGEMEVWALEAYGAAHMLQEMLTIKSDDVTGRIRTYEAIIKGAPVLQPSVPESFKILTNELRALGLKVTLIDTNNNPIELRSLEDLEDEDHNRPKLRLPQTLGEDDF
ncbi:MAG: DNA-directed RNA polymerase subunit beta [Fimbriimonadia bacterium]|nr:DNA-directed RNA polymerase subunit beta [Fimbriimonadia bacterium]